ncbi:hypothetical protein GCM10022408_10120 [Hymenobacter fastidiosus]|uniref:Uncharacterized protein n=1 Tax=Hymenobacter fastidiosus TaxID=486264 RepID=A0ABP7RR61_9BACT
MNNQVVGYILVAIDKQSADGKSAKFGFFYCPELDQSIHFRFSALQGDYTEPTLGDKVQAEVKDSLKGPSAQRLRLLLPAVEVPQEELAIEIGHLAKTLRCTTEAIVTALAQLSYPVAPGNPVLLAVPQALAARNMLEQSRDQRPKSADSSASLLPIQFGVVKQYFADREYGFIQQQDFADTYFKASVTKFSVRAGDSVFFRRKTRSETGQAFALEVTPISKSIELIRHNYRTFSQTVLGHALSGADQALKEQMLTWQLGIIVHQDQEQLEEAAQAHLHQVHRHCPSEIQLHLNQLLPTIGPAKALAWWQSFAASYAMPEQVVTALRQLATLSDDGMRLALERVPSQQLLDYLPIIWPAETVRNDLEATGGANVAAFWGTAIHHWPLATKHKAGNYFAELREVELARILYETYRYILPVYDYIYTAGNQLDQASLLELLEVATGDHVVTLIASQIVDKVETIDTSIVTLVDKLAKYLLPTALGEIKASIVLKATALQQVLIYLRESSFKIDLTDIAGKLTNQDLQQVMEPAGQNKELTQQVRLWAAQHLLARIQGDAHNAPQPIFSLLTIARRKLDTVLFDTLLEQSGEVGRTWAELHNWLEVEGPTPSLNTLLAFLALPETDSPFSQSDALNQLTEEALLTLLQLLVDEEPRDLMKISTPLLVHWISRLPETEERQRTLSRLVWTERQPLMLLLWLEGLSTYYDFARFKTLVFTLPIEKQYQFLRKTFQLIDDQQVKLTLADLNTIVRYSKTEAEVMGVRLDYTVDLVLTTLMMLKTQLCFPQERDILDFVAKYVGEEVKELPTFIDFFEKCTGRGESLQVKDKAADKGKAYTEEFGCLEGTADTKRVFIDGVGYGVAGGAFYKDGKRIKVLKWETKEAHSYIVNPRRDNAPIGVKCCEGRQSNKLDKESNMPFSWCRGFPCFGPNQVADKPSIRWKSYVLRDFINILGLPFDLERYYSFIGTLNRVNQLLERLKCQSCQRILRPVGNSDFHLYRVTRFHCTHSECSNKEEVYLSTCLNGRCQLIIDSRISKRCTYHDLGYDWTGPYICSNCGGCCSKQMIESRKATLERVYQPNQLATNSQYHLLVNQLSKKLYHADIQVNFCYKCQGKMEEIGRQGDYGCPKCNTRYARYISYLHVHKKRLEQPMKQ